MVIPLYNYELVIALIISILIIAPYYMMKNYFQKMDSELFENIYFQKEQELAQWIEKYKESILFKTVIQHNSSEILNNVYEKWQLHNELQKQIVINTIKIKKNKL